MFQILLPLLPMRVSSFALLPTKALIWLKVPPIAVELLV